MHGASTAGGQRIAKANDNHEAAKAKRKAVEDRWKSISEES